MAGKDKGADTGDYSATKAPENTLHVESEWQSNGPAQKPGGPKGAPTDVGMSGLDSDSSGEQSAPGDDAQHAGNPTASHKGPADR